MQTLRLNNVLKIASTRKNIIRYSNVAVNNASVDEDLSAATKTWQEIPGPSSLPIIRQLHHFLPGGSLYNVNNTEVLEKLHSTYGPIMKMDLIIGKPPIIVLFDAESSAQVLRGENWMPTRPGFMTLEYYRRKYVKKHEDDPTGLLSECSIKYYVSLSEKVRFPTWANSGPPLCVGPKTSPSLVIGHFLLSVNNLLFFTHGEVWKKFRSTVNPVLLQPKTVKLYSAALDVVAQDMIARMKSIRGEDNTLKTKFDMEMNLWSLESIGVVALGDRLNCLDPNLPEDSPARKLIQVVHDFFIVVEKLDFQPSFWEYISTPLFRKAMKIYEQEEKLTQYFVKRAVEKLSTSNKKSDDEKGVLEKLLEIDEKIACIMAADMLFAGVDTTANTMTYALYLLAKNPEKQEKLREEVMGQKDSRPYLKACIKETLRLLPVIAGNMRLTTKEYNLMGYKIPKNMFVTFSNQLMSVSETHYKRASEFIPERWLVPKDDPLYYGNAHPFAYAPFGFGARSCIGRRIAELEIETFLAKIMENFKVDWTGPPLKIQQAAINYASGPFSFTFKDV